MKKYLVDGTEQRDSRLARLELKDDRDSVYQLRKILEAGKKPRSYTWRCYGHLNQGQEGSCVGHGFAHRLLSRPEAIKTIDHPMARYFYFLAQMRDPWPGGAYDGAEEFYEGSSVRGGAKAMVDLGYAKTYWWAGDLEDLIMGVGYKGPAIMGTIWTNDMFYPDEKGFISPTGKNAGGHCYLVTKVNVRKEFFGIKNSWNSPDLTFITFEDMEILLRNAGEACFLTQYGRIK